MSIKPSNPIIHQYTSMYDKIDNLLAKFVHFYRGHTIPKKSAENDDNASIHSTPSDLDLVDIHKQSSDVGDYNYHLYLKCLIHELRTPVSTISMGLDILLDGAKMDADKQTINDLKKSIKYIENTFNKFMIIQDGNLVLNPYEAVSISQLIRIIETLLYYNFKKTNTKFTYHIAAGIQDWVFCDMHNIKHVFVNLLKNALKYQDPSRENKVTIDIAKVPSREPITTNNIKPKAPDRPMASKHGGGGVLYRSRSISPGKLGMDSSQPSIIPISEETASSAKFRTAFGRSLREPPPPQYQTIQISISDTNSHILPNIKEHLFETFNTTSGSGLGLYICKNIIDLHGGTIEHEFIEPRGNRFVITIPLEICRDMTTIVAEHGSNTNLASASNNAFSSFNLAVEPDIPHDLSVSHRTSKNPSPLGSCKLSPSPKYDKKYTAIIIDDSLLNRKMLYKVLNITGFFRKVYTGDDNPESIKRLYENIQSIDIVFIDKNMPYMCGTEIVGGLRKRGYNGWIVGLTGEEDRVFAGCGLDFICIKPVEKKKIDDIMEQIVKMGRPSVLSRVTL